MLTRIRQYDQNLTSTELSCSMLLNCRKRETSSSLFFRLCYDFANDGNSVLLICLKGKYEIELPMYVSNDDDTEHRYCQNVLEQIKIFYVNNFTEMIQLLSTIDSGYFQSTRTPITIAISDLSSIISSEFANDINISSHSNPSKCVKARLLLFSLLNDIKRASQFKVKIIITDDLNDNGLITMYARVLSIVICESEDSQDMLTISTFTDLMNRKPNSFFCKVLDSTNSILISS